MTAVAVEHRPDRPMFGIATMLLTTFCFTLHDACVKLLSDTWPLTQIVLVIASTVLIVLGALRVREAGLGGLRSAHPGVQALRAILLPICALGSFWAYSSMPLADAYAINFVQPLVITALSVPLLGEKVGWRRWTAVAVGFVGVVVMLRPGSGLLGPPGLGMLGAACLAATTIVLLRKAPNDPPLVSAFWVMLGMAVVGWAALPFSGVAVTASDVGIGIVAGLLGAVAFLSQAFSLRAAKAAVTAPFQYTQILWGLLVGAILFGDPPPDTTTLIGAGIVVASGLYVLHRETVRRAEA